MQFSAPILEGLNFELRHTSKIFEGHSSHNPRPGLLLLRQLSQQPFHDVFGRPWPHCIVKQCNYLGQTLTCLVVQSHTRICMYIYIHTSYRYRYRIDLWPFTVSRPFLFFFSTRPSSCARLIPHRLVIIDDRLLDRWNQLIQVGCQQVLAVEEEKVTQVTYIL